MSAVSVIIPTYKGSRYLARALDSVLAQDYLDYEIIVVDDNNPKDKERYSTEQCMEMYENIKNIAYIKHDRNMNGSVARNTGIRHSNGTYISFLDDDDFYMPARLKKCVLEIEKSHSDAIYTNVVIVKNHVPCKIIYANTSGCLFLNMLLDENIIGTGSNIFIKKNICEEIGMFNETLVRHQDYEFLLRMFSKGYIAHALKESLVTKAVNDTNNSVNYRQLKEIKEGIFCYFEKEIKRLDFQSKQNVQINQYKELYHAALLERNIAAIEKEKTHLVDVGYIFGIKDKIKETVFRTGYYGLFQKIYWYLNFLKLEIGASVSDEKEVCEHVTRILKRYN